MLEFDRIETPQNVELIRPLAGMGTRLFAGLIDQLLFVLVLVFLYIFIALFYATNPIQYMRTMYEVNSLLFSFLILLFFTIYWGYYMFFEFFWNGQSIGKRYMKIRVVKQEGGAVEFSEIAIRNLIRVVDGLMFYLVAGASMFFSERVQRLGDLAAGTVVVSEQEPVSKVSSDESFTAVATNGKAPAALQDYGITPELYRTLKSYCERRNQFEPQARMALLPKLISLLLQQAGEAMDDALVKRLQEPVTKDLYKLHEEILVLILEQIEKEDSASPAGGEETL